MKRSRVPHCRRPEVGGPVHVTLRLKGGLPSMRTPRAYRVLERALRAGSERFGMRVCEYSVLRNHLHLFVDVDSRRALSRGMQGLGIRIAKALNRHWHRKGSVFADRFHARWLRGVNQVRRALRYVLQNARKHGIRIPAGKPDPYSSARWFRGWHSTEHFTKPLRSTPVALPRWWQSRQWRRLGTLSLNVLPSTRPTS